MASPLYPSFSLTQRLNVVNAKSDPHSSTLLNKDVSEMGKPQTPPRIKERIVLISLVLPDT